MLPEKVYVSRPWEYEEKKKGKYLLIWPDIPMWIVADNELYLFLRLLDGDRDISEIVSILHNKLGKDKHSIKMDIHNILPELINRQIVFERGKDIRKVDKRFDEAKIDTVYISVTSRCNLNCKMCFNKYNRVTPDKELTADEIKKFVDQLVEFCEPYANVSISGGEPFVVPDKTFEIAEYLSQRFRYVWIITNGTLIDRYIAKKLRDLDILTVVSLDGANEKAHDNLRGKGSFKKTIEGIKVLKDEGVYVVTNCIIHRGNLNQINEYFELAKKLNVDEVRFVQLKLVGGALHSDLKKVYIDEIVDYMYNLFMEHPEYNSLRGRDVFTVLGLICRRSVKQKWCGAGKLTLSLNADGTIYPCASHWSSEFAAGNIKEKSFSDIWLNSPTLKRIRKVYNVDGMNDVCSRCIVRYWCAGWCRAETYYLMHDMRSPSPECERIKKAIIKMFWILSDHPEFGKMKNMYSGVYSRI